MLKSKIYRWGTNVHMANRNAKYVIFMLLYSISTRLSNNLTARKPMSQRFDCVTGVMAEWEFACLLVLTGLYQQQHITIYCFVFIMAATSSYFHCQFICWWLKFNCFSVKHQKIACHSLPRKDWHVRVLFCPDIGPKDPRLHGETPAHISGWNVVKKRFYGFLLDLNNHYIYSKKYFVFVSATFLMWTSSFTKTSWSSGIFWFWSMLPTLICYHKKKHNIKKKKKSNLYKVSLTIKLMNENLNTFSFNLYSFFPVA